MRFLRESPARESDDSSGGRSVSGSRTGVSLRQLSGSVSEHSTAEAAHALGPLTTLGVGLIVEPLAWLLTSAWPPLMPRQATPPPTPQSRNWTTHFLKESQAPCSRPSSRRWEPACHLTRTKETCRVQPNTNNQKANHMTRPFGGPQPMHSLRLVWTEPHTAKS